MWARDRHDSAADCAMREPNYTQRRIELSETMQTDMARARRGVHTDLTLCSFYHQESTAAKLQTTAPGHMSRRSRSLRSRPSDEICGRPQQYLGMRKAKLCATLQGGKCPRSPFQQTALSSDSGCGLHQWPKVSCRNSSDFI